MALQDNNIHWRPSTKLQRFIVIITSGSPGLYDPSTPQFKDKCNQGKPTPEKAGREFRQSDAGLLVLVYGSSTILDSWNNYVQKMNISVHGIVQRFDGTSSMFQDIVPSILNEAMCQFQFSSPISTEAPGTSTDAASTDAASTVAASTDTTSSSATTTAKTFSTLPSTPSSKAPYIITASAVGGVALLAAGHFIVSKYFSREAIPQQSDNYDPGYL